MTLGLLVVFILGLIPVHAANSISVIVNGRSIQFDVQPVIENGRTLVPVRAIFEALGAEVAWDGNTRTVIAVKGTRKVNIRIDSTDATVNGFQKTLDVPAKIIQNRTLVPLRFISEGLGSIVSWDGTTRTAKISDAGLKVSFIDVGQADSILVETPGGKSMLIDAGNNEDGDKVTSYIKGEGLNKVDVLVATHSHEDHIGGMDTVVNNFDIGKVYMSHGTTTTKTYQDVLTAIQNKGLKITSAKSGGSIDLDPELKIDILAPHENDVFQDLNNYSVVLKVTYKNNSFLLTGDAEDSSEVEMLMTGADLKADVLKVGHHGSNSSTTDKFLQSISPKYAVISVGKGNDYGHPAQQTLDKLVAANVQVFRTDVDGTIVASSDGNTIAFNKISAITTSTPKPSTVPKPTATPWPSQVYKPSPDYNITGVIISKVDLRGELATITNKSASNVNMTGWKLVSVKGNQTYNFPSGFTLKAGSSVNITSGSKAYSGPNTLKWTTSNIWNNDGDPAKLYDNSGRVVSTK